MGGGGTFGDDAAQGHPFVQAVVADDGLPLGRQRIVLGLHQQSDVIRRGGHRDMIPGSGEHQRVEERAD